MNNETKSTNASKRRKLEELDLLDDFLFQEMVSQEDVGEEFCRILLSTILNRTIRKLRVIPQRNILGIDTDKHGIRLDAYIEDISNEEMEIEAVDAEVLPDIYDMEPNKVYEKKSLPKRMRYYHGLIDSQLLAASVEYEKLQRVVIIVILPYDPFGKERMVYTVKNQCVEDASIFYDDGAEKIFLYTKGTKGNPSQQLRDMLKYIEQSDENNVTNQDLERIQNMVQQVKRRKEVSINYMKSWEREKMIQERAEAEGRKIGEAEGRKIGEAEGRKIGEARGEAKTIFSIIRKFKEKNQDIEMIAEFTDLGQDYVKQVIKLIEEYPDKTDQELAEIMMNQ